MAHFVDVSHLLQNVLSQKLLFCELATHYWCALSGNHCSLFELHYACSWWWSLLTADCIIQPSSCHWCLCFFCFLFPLPLHHNRNIRAWASWEKCGLWPSVSEPVLGSDCSSGEWGADRYNHVDCVVLWNFRVKSQIFLEEHKRARVCASWNFCYFKAYILLQEMGAKCFSSSLGRSKFLSRCLWLTCLHYYCRFLYASTLIGWWELNFVGIASAKFGCFCEITVETEARIFCSITLLCTKVHGDCWQA